MPVINGVYLKDFTALPSSVTDANIIPIAITGDQVAYRTTVGGIVTDARITSKLLTGLSVTGSTILATDTILEAFGKVQNQLNGKVSSVGLTMPAAFNVANSPITSAGTLAVTAAGVASQYIRGDGALADFPTTGGGGSSVSYYLNGSVSQGTFVGNTYYEMNKTPVIGTGTDFTIGADGYIAQFITDANDPASLLIPAGNWNVEMYFSASSNGGTPSFYVEVYKYDGSTFTLLGTSSATPEGITNGTAIDIYYTSVGIPETVLTITDRLAIRVYVTHSGRTITLHTEDNHLSEIVTTFSNGLTTLNGLTKQAQYFAVGSTGTDFAIVSSVDTHTFNLPTASATNRGALSSADWTTFNNKQSALTNPVTGTGTSGQVAYFNGTSSITSESNLFWDATNNRLGIGVATPTAELDVSTSDNAIIKIASTGATRSAILRAINNIGTSIDIRQIGSSVAGNTLGVASANLSLLISGSSLAIGTALANDLTLGTNNAANLTIKSGGNVLINTQTDAGFRLDVNGTARVSGVLTLSSTISNGTYTYTLPSATGTLALVGGAGVGTVTSVAALTLGTSGTDLSSTVANGTTTPVITLNVPTASGSNRGVLSSTDWTTFNSKQGTITLTTTGSSGAATFVSNTLNIPQYTVLSLAAIGITPNANGGSIVGSLLSLQPADASFGGVVTTGTQTFAGDKTLTGTLYGIGLSMTGTTADIVQGTATSGKALRGTATTGWGLYASATTGVGVQGNSSGTGGSGVFGSSVDGYGGIFYNDSTTYPALEVNNNNESAGNIAVFRKAGTSVFIINSSGNISNGTYTYTLPSATGTLALTSAIPANPVGGTGTINTLPKFTAASTIGNSAITDDGTTVTLVSRALSGTSATFSSSVTANSFVIANNAANTISLGNSAIGSFGNIAFYGNGTGAGTTLGQFPFYNKRSGSDVLSAFIEIAHEGSSSDDKAYILFGTHNGTSYAERMRITSGGNVGIGTATPLEKLQVSGAITATGAATNAIGSSSTMDFSSGNTRLISRGVDASTQGAYQFRIETSAGSGSSALTISNSGAVTIAGSLSKGSGSFRIEHPLPSLSETHQLVHSFIEGPQADLIYRGRLTLLNGKAQANIDEVSTMTEGTFEVLCREVQCFTTNESGWDLIKGKVIGNIIYIESQNQNSTDEISWMVIGERKDKHMMETEWTDENGKVIVEPLKPIEPEPIEEGEPIVPEVTTEPIVPTDNNLE